eukprot:m.219592 g.219592  ORF g.219592 m.219592 type:complete len:54 (+) comp17235_c0_seq9:1772-1933(+)
MIKEIMLVPLPLAAIKFLISFLIFHISTLRSPSSSAMMLMKVLQPREMPRWGS